MDWLHKKAHAAIIAGRPAPIKQIDHELRRYFASDLTTFHTPICLLGTPFQQHVWDALLDIPYGETRTYTDMAATIGNPAAVRAVGSANGANPFAVVVPCHRLIRSDGSLANYGGGVHRKQWLLQHEQSLV